ncbi:NlpC/P60 family protein [Psychromicrobium xiongbiense]|uniref:NlpC/P60 family protein n=1 Tax=Psychromicrobium xiongbiense TaxID=3051184 RepID=UPI002555A528|nr:NlpC/P60 family protein [Psychromicrobium sp. YIM S02556]
MSNRAGIARHRSAAPKTSSLAIIAKAVGDNAGGVGRQAAVIAAASGLVLTTGLAANAATTTEPQQVDNKATLAVDSTAPVVTASSTVKIEFEQAVVSSTPSPKPVVTVQTQAAKPVQQAAAPVAAAKPTAAPATPAPAVGSGVGAIIAAAAYSQLGVMQDCTALASNSLAAAGIFYHGWPAGYLSLGRTVSQAEAQPGDLIYYANGGAGAAHIAVYVGNGMAVHGGFNGNQTKLFTVNVGSGPVFIAIGH